MAAPQRSAKWQGEGDAAESSTVDLDMGQIIGVVIHATTKSVVCMC